MSRSTRRNALKRAKKSVLPAKGTPYRKVRLLEEWKVGDTTHRWLLHVTKGFRYETVAE